MVKEVPVLCIVGPSRSGKTTLMEALIKELSSRGYRVATIKHSHHTVELDQPGKDSWRHRQAGAILSIFASPRSVAVFSDLEQELTLEELCVRFIHQADIVLVEGYKSTSYPKLLVLGDGRWNEMEWEGVTAIVSVQNICVNVPVFRPDDVAGMVTFLADKFLGGGKP